MLLKTTLLNCPDIEFQKIAKQFISKEFNEIAISNIFDDSRKVVAGSCFVAIKGALFDGHSAIKEVIGKKVSVIFLESLLSTKIYKQDGVLCIPVSDTRKLLSNLAYAFHKNKLQNIKSVGITGTNGKTSISYLLEFLLRQQKEVPGVMGTVNHHINKKVWPTALTSPSVLNLYQRLADFNQEKMTTLILEVSSHGLSQHRLIVFPFQAVVFTNLTQDHLDYHESMANYFAEKQKLFLKARELMQTPCSAIINIDDSYGKKLQVALHLKRWTYGQDSSADFSFKVIKENLEGMTISLKFQKKIYVFTTALIGLHNAYNIVASVVVAYDFGYDIQSLAKSLSLFKGIPGRLQKVENTCKLSIFVDYAHTPNAISSVLLSVKPLAKRVGIVFGCGGDRDKLKRPLMLQEALKIAHFIVLTSDNPREEKPESIIKDILNGTKVSDYPDKLFVICNRKEAIQFALTLQGKDDVLIIAGKGHEQEQIVKNKTFFWNDYTEVQRLLKNG
ncbi:MAG: UDP-N-acetylmuramoyl-L-alanyl-D-glutamate--2,6-diaminopimelate ligase [Bdellovibrionaceae bacterium]|nr:UDP-N-acetylmuramoyl-L-alanyl-D-glutamate--2,6-diaminopimelate ligase [Pseudobdellovibrionaceae bacterium]